jgi:polysaccharide export outer membrane protein
MKNQTHSFAIHSLLSPQFYIIISFCFFFLSSCRTQKQAQYFYGYIDTAALANVNIPEPVIQKGDLIGITVYSDNPAATAIYNQAPSASLLPAAASDADAGLSGGQSSSSMSGYLVDPNGNIRFQSVGLLHIEGMTRASLEQMLQEKLTPFLKNPYCDIRFLNYKFTILGEVANKGSFPIANEKTTILDALGMAGDVTEYGLKDSILVIREMNGKRSFGYLNVSKPEVMLSPYYYLRQNDVVIVRTSSKKPSISEEAAVRRLSIAATITSLLVTISLLISRL